MNEIWKDIPNYEDIYQVSNLGNVKSLSRKIISNNGFYFSKEIILKPSTQDGYLQVKLSKYNKAKKLNSEQSFEYDLDIEDGQDY